MCKNIINKELDQCSIDLSIKIQEDESKYYEVSFLLTKKDYCQVKDSSFEKVIYISKGMAVDNQPCYKKIKIVIGRIFEYNYENASFIIDKNKELIKEQANLFYNESN